MLKEYSTDLALYFWTPDYKNSSTSTHQLSNFQIMFSLPFPFIRHFMLFKKINGPNEFHQLLFHLSKSLLYVLISNLSNIIGLLM